MSSTGTSSFSILSAKREDFGDGHRAGRNCLHHVMLEAVLDALGDFDFAFAGQQLHGAHFARMYMRTGSVVYKFTVQLRNGLFGFFRHIVIGHGRRGFVMINSSAAGASSNTWMPMSLIIATILSIALGIDQIIGEVVVDFGVGQIPAVLAEGDELLEAQAAGFRINRLERRQGLEQRLLLFLQ